jgi:endonuclease/exonuclease/phosphatase family metal-dependent hydrolase
MHSRLVTTVRLAVMATVSAALFLAAAPSAAQTNARPVTVMTRNLYLGADLTPLTTAPTFPEFTVRVKELFGTVQATNFPARAKVLAREIRDADPTLIGLQEVSLWRTGQPGVLDGPVTPATTIVYDYLDLLRAELAAIGRPYNIVTVRSHLDAEAPSALGFDVRLTQRNVILAKAGLPADELRLSNPSSGQYSVNLTIPTAAGGVLDQRGWTAVDATVNQREFRFINTHLDSTVPAVREAQARELLAGPANYTKPVVLVGDLNSDPSEPAPSAYATLTGAGFVDTWKQLHGSTPGLTWGHAENLLNPVPTFTTRLDYVMTRPSVPVIRTRLIGIDPDNRTPTGLWPSDHAGVVATLAP